MEVPPSTLRFLQYYTMILQRIRIIVVDAGVEPGASAPEVWRATNEPPHPLIYKILKKQFLGGFRLKVQIFGGHATS